MASPQFISSLRLPLTEKPLTPPSEIKIYNDIFNIQNTIRITLRNIVEEAPKDGKSYVRKDGAWVEDTGGSGFVYVPGQIYLLPGYTSGSSQRAAPVTNTARGFLINAGNYGNARPAVVNSGTFVGNIRFALYDSVTRVLIKDLGEITLTSGGPSNSYNYGPTPIGVLDTHAILMLFFSVTLGNYLVYIQYGVMTSTVPQLWFSISTSVTQVLTRYELSITYPTGSLPSPLPAFTLTQAATVTLPLFIGVPAP